MRSKRFIPGFVVLVGCLLGIGLMLGTGLLGAARQKAFAASAITATDYTIPAGSDPWGTAVDSSGKIWVAIPGCDPGTSCNSSTPPGQIALFHPAASTWSTYPLPAGYGQPLMLSVTSKNMLWFTMPMSNSIGRFNIVNHKFAQWHVPTANSEPWSIVVDHNGKVWFGERALNKIGEFDPTTNTFHEFATPTADSQPYGITVDASNNIWFTENNDAHAQIGEYTAQGQMLEYKIRNGSTGGVTPHLIVVDPNGNIWWTEGWAGRIGELHIAQAQPGTNNGVNEYAYPALCSTCGMHTSGIAVDNKGNIWFDDSLQSTYGSFPDTGTGSFTLYTTPSPNSHPHDGLTVDSKGRVWFDEEFANKLAKVTPAKAVKAAKR